ncbi:hypothetical protein AN396_08030 [Candidatus Epulonipiscium fishelsonii]|uniref:Uncharacterized protein n=1 Tax=Candidatus Epulonipiscium fishelsonii TaxID=77094 RepID=A0ACC8XAM5_9FIRM|nr:hypothetical protein AN396_08030 [Epulopiscium sp. SCG-B11WGA-EpuloA1]
MKTSVSLATFKGPADMPALYQAADRAGISHIKSLEYDGVDLFIKDPKSDETKNTINLLKEFSLGISVILPASLTMEQLYLGAKNEDVRKKAVEKMLEIIEFAKEQNTNVALGLIRGSVEEEDTLANFEKRFVKSCEELLKVSKPLGVDLLLEPINRYEINNINTVQDGLDFLERTKLPIYFMIDTYHMYLENENIADMLVKGLPYTKHIHFLDSNRLSPSMGKLNMAFYYKLLEQNGYKGYLGLETLPSPSRQVCAIAGASFFYRMRNNILN